MALICVVFLDLIQILEIWGRRQIIAMIKEYRHMISKITACCNISVIKCSVRLFSHAELYLI
jgi:hypothetical protein